jgi:hypothetical protein
VLTQDDSVVNSRVSGATADNDYNNYNDVIMIRMTAKYDDDNQNFFFYLHTNPSGPTSFNAILSASIDELPWAMLANGPA